MSEPSEKLDLIFQNALDHQDESFLEDSSLVGKINDIATNSVNRACVRFLMACLLAKIQDPHLDIRKPYTEIGDADCYSGRVYDEKYINPFVHKYELPCNSTTAFLTPAFRNITTILTPEREIAGTPKKLYKETLEILDLVQKGDISPETVFNEILRDLINLKREKQQRIDSLLKEVRSTKGNRPLSSEQIVSLIEQHLRSPKSSRLPVIAVAAAYQAASEYLKEKMLPLADHHAADKQTKNLGDLEITLMNDDNIVTCYEMKTRKVTVQDVEDSLNNKVLVRGQDIDNYIIITTEVIDKEVEDYCKGLYEETGGIEFMVLDCITFVRHFLHLFHRIRCQYLDAYQSLLMNEPDSGVDQHLKEAFLSLRLVAEKNTN